MTTGEKHRRRAMAEGLRGNGQLRAEMYARAEFFAWSARRFSAPAFHADPITGRDPARYPHACGGPGAALRIHRAMESAAARECYAIARRMPGGLQLVELAAASTRCAR